jgi:putative transposase
MSDSAVDDPGERVALFRFSVISEAVSDALTGAERGAIVRRVAGESHRCVDGEHRRFSRCTLDRWIAAYRRHGLSGLAPHQRSDTGMARDNTEWFELAERLRREVPARSAAHIVDIIGRAHGVWLADRTVRAHLARKGLHRAALAAEPAKAFGRFEASRPNEIWIGDVLVGPFVPHPRVTGSKRAKLFLLVDDHSRLIIHGRWTPEENTRAGQDVLRAAIGKHGLPVSYYCDNGSPYSNAHLDRTCAVLGIHLVHSKPYQPQGRGKQERLNRFIRDRFLTEAIAAGITDFDQLNDRFDAWAESSANTRVHTETGETPVARFNTGFTASLPDPALVTEAFLWAAHRVVTKTATISFQGNRYSVDASLVGRHVELRYDPTNLASIAVYHEGTHVGAATPFTIGRHVHPAVPQAAPEPPPEPVGIDYLALIEDQHTRDNLGDIPYRDIPLTGFEHLADQDEAQGT